ncbi:MAG: lamin tail domain-containing protein [Bacteroidia bacterium]|jgi:hypothetical protein|nr:lamin tail domain-containing protein [Bacteroidia bacterium]
MKKALLSLAFAALTIGASAQSAACTELFFSEYVEGSSHSKALEIYNPTANPVNLSNYRLVRYSNGSPTGVDSITLQGSIPSRDVWVVVNGQATPDQNGAFCDPALLAMGDLVGPSTYVNGTAVMYFNGDDAIVLARIQPYAIVDIFGKIGEDPGSAWTDVFPYTDAQGTWWTRDHSLTRKTTVGMGVTTSPSAFNVTLEYDSMPENTWTGLGQHSCFCNTLSVNDPAALNNGVKVFPNPTNGILQLNARQNIARVSVYNMVGQVVVENIYEAADQRNAQTLNLTTQPAGIYMVQTELANGTRITTKISVR